MKKNTSEAALVPLAEIIANPSGFDSLSNYSGSIPEESWLCLLTRTRDADCLAESNFTTALARLGGESENVQIHRFSHWACGWWEALAVAEGTPAHQIAKDLKESLHDYPILDEGDFSERETAAADEAWKVCFDAEDRIRWMRENYFHARDFKDLRAQVRGDYFGGYASDLLR